VPVSRSEPIDEFSRAFIRDSAITLHLRTYYLDRHTPTPPGLGAWAGGGWLGYQSGWFADVLRVGVVGYTSQPIWAPDHRDGTLLLKPDQQGYSVLGQAYVQLKLRDQVFTGYRQVIDQPEVNLQDNRMTPNTFEAYTVTGKLGAFDYFVGYLDRMKTRNSHEFRNMAAVAGAPSEESEGLWLGTVGYSPLPGLKARLSSYHVPNIIQSTYSDVVWLTPLSNTTQLRLGAQFMFQSSAGDNLLTGASFDTWSGGAKADVIVGPFTGSVAYTQTDRDSFYRSPYGSWAGYTSMIVKDFNRAGEHAFLVGATFDFASLNLPGLSFNTNAVFGRNAIEPVTGLNISDINEYDFTLDYRFTGNNWPDALKPLWIRARHAYIEEKLAGVNDVTKDYRIIVNYEWVFKVD
jgi:hypothetical protein